MQAYWVPGPYSRVALGAKGCLPSIAGRETLGLPLVAPVAGRYSPASRVVALWTCPAGTPLPAAWCGPSNGCKAEGLTP